MDRRRYIATINIHPFYTAYRHLWGALETKIDALAALIAERHIHSAFTLQKQSAYVWTLNIPHMTQDNQEMMAAVIQSDLLLALMHIMRAQEAQASGDKDCSVAQDGYESEGGIGALYARPSVTAPLAKKKLAKERPPMMLDVEGKPVLSPDITLLLQPIFYPGQRGVVSFMVMPQLHYGDGVLQGYDVLPEDAPLTLIIALDMHIIDRAKQELQMFEDRKIKNRKVLCPVHRATLFNENGCSCYLNACNALPQNFRENFGLDIHHMTGPWYAPALKPQLSPFKMLGFLLYARVGLDAVDAQALFDSGIEGVSVSFAEVSDSPAVKQRAKKLVKAANRLQLRALACDLDELATLKIAEKAGFSRLVGDAVHVSG